MTCDILDDREAILRRAETWLALERRARDLSPFQTWRWTKAWLEHFGRDGAPLRPLVVLARGADGAPLALMPMQLDRHVGMRRITWLSVPALQQGGPLTAPLPEEAVREILQELMASLHDRAADFISLPLLSSRSMGVLRDAQPSFRPGKQTAAFRVNLSGFADWRAFELALKPSARRARKKRLNRLKREGDVTFKVHPAGDVPPGLLQGALGWKRVWLRERGLRDSLPMHRAFGPFLHALLSAPAEPQERGRWLAAELRLDGRPLAVDVGMALDGVFHAWFSAYDPAFAAHSPGKIALWLMLRWCKENGLHAYDMLANSAPYKIDWANEEIPLGSLVLPLSMGGLAYTMWKTHAEGMARQAYGALPSTLRAAVRRPLMRLRGGGVS